jgi:hypothetical protein
MLQVRRLRTSLNFSIDGEGRLARNERKSIVREFRGF